MAFLKWPVLICTLLAVLPLSKWLQRNPDAAPKVWILIGILPFVYTGLGTDQPLFITLIDGYWAGFTRGIEFSIIDALALVIYFSLPRARHAVPFRFSMFLYFFAVLLSVFQSDAPMSVLYYCWQLARMFLLYVIVVRACSDERVPLALLTGMTIGLCFQTAIGFYQKSFVGADRAGGALGSQNYNYIGMLSHFPIFPLFALLLAEQRGWQLLMGPLAGVISAILTVSRATIGLNALGLVLVYVISVLQRWTSRKAVIGLSGVILIAALSPFAISSLGERYSSGDAEGSANTRDAFNQAASWMIEDHPMGVGANNYIRTANIGGYNLRADLPLSELGIAIHNTYYLVTAETGYFGLFAFVLLLLRIIVTSFRCGWQNKANLKGSMLLSLGITLLITYIHSWFESQIMGPGIQYPFVTIAGIVAGLATQLGYWRPT